MQKEQRHRGACGVVSVVANITGSTKRAKVHVEKGEGACHTTTLVVVATSTNQFQSC